ncbi:MAG TPA: DUF4147 domain-containing protein [Gammaproteobacteria bacterium]|nr:DUF4147 domain-containing protein [Gammaproteobacteria bacterium]
MLGPAAPSRVLLLDLYRHGVAAVHGGAIVRAWLTSRPELPPFHLVAIGKAAAAMTSGVLTAASEGLQSGLVITRYGHLTEPVYQDPRLVCLEAGHPLPDTQSLAAGQALQLFLEQAPREAHFLFLISGGTSSLVEVPAPGITLADLRQLNLWLLGSGLSIGDVNHIRSAVSRIKGGRLASLLYGRRAVQLLMSDVPGDVPADIGSGLLSPAPSRPLPKLPARFSALPFQQATLQRVQDVETHIVASNRQLREAVADAGRAAGHLVYDHGVFPLTDAAACGEALARTLRNASPGVHVWGGETTVHLPENPGQGGRNQHLALAAARVLADASEIALLAMASDGSDGATDDAGALVDGGSLERGVDAGYDSADCLKRAASAEFLEGSGDLVHTGPTGTNVMDIVIAYKARG